MAKIRKAEKREMPALNTSSLPDIIFMLLFFFMTVTSMKEVTYKVTIKNPSATELTKLEKKSDVRYIYVGSPTLELQKEYGSETRIQLDDAFAEASDIKEYMESEIREAISKKATSDASQTNPLTVSIKADSETRMGVISDIKQQLRHANALKISYAAVQRTNY